MSETLVPTVTHNTLPQRLGDFETLTDALDYAAQGVTGFNFHDPRGNLASVLPYSQLRDRAIDTASRLLSLGLERGQRVAIIADNSPEFTILFFACRYAGLVPFAMPIPVNLGSHDIYVQQLNGLLSISEATIAVANKEYFNFLKQATSGLSNINWVGTPDQVNDLEKSEQQLEKNHPDDVAYLQFTSGSTRFPQGVVITESAVMSNLQGIVRNGLKIYPSDRCASWLPFYHDMGLVGLVLSPMVSQISVDFLSTRAFAIRPIQWLRIITRNKCTIAFGPPFGFELCSMRVRNSDLEGIDLSSWRAAGVGAEMIRPSTLKDFADKFASVGFKAETFLPCYGLAEASLAVTFAKVNTELETIKVDTETLMKKGVIVQVHNTDRKFSEFVNCGRALDGHEVNILDDDGKELPEGRVGSVLIKGPSIMTGYLNDEESTQKTIKPGGWLDTGDFGFQIDGNLYITGRRNDIIIINGRNIRSQDIEEIAEQQEEIRARESSAFGITDNNGDPLVVLVVECRVSPSDKRQLLTNKLQRLVYSAFGVNCLVELVPPHTLPRTSSGKLSRAAARRGFMERNGLPELQPASSDIS